MTTFQAIVTSIVTVFSEVLPISPIAHHRILSYFFHWSEPGQALLATIYLGLFLALLFTFKYDFLSFISQTLQVLIYRKKPTAIDEKLPLFVLTSLLAPVAAWFLFREQVDPMLDNPLLVAGILAGAGLPMVFLDSYSKKNKTHYDWNWLDAFLLGFGQALFLIPGVGRATGALTITCLRNFSRIGAAKFILYGATPIVGVMSYQHLHHVGFFDSIPGEISTLTFAVSLLVSFLGGLLAIHSFMNQMSQGTLKKYAIYRILLATAIVAIYFAREKGMIS